MAEPTPVSSPSPTAPAPAGADRLVGADGLRALAALWVYFDHLFRTQMHTDENLGPLHHFLAAGFWGVPIFFVLSGFLLSMPFWKAQRKGAGLAAMPSLKVYAIRRAARIVPAYWLCVLVLTVAVGEFHSKWHLAALAARLSFTNTFIAGMYIWDPPDGSLWSIPVEVQFYVLLPLFAVGLLLMRNRWAARAYCVAVIVAIWLAQLAFLRYAAPAIEQRIHDASIFTAQSWAAERNALGMFTHFLIGVVAADAYLAIAEHRGRTRSDAPPKPALFNAFDVVALVMLAVIVVASAFPAAFSWPRGGSKLPSLDVLDYGWPFFHGVIGVLLVTMPFSRVIGPALDNSILRITAVLSFGIYIWHQPVLLALDRYWPHGADRWPVQPWAFAAAGLLASYLVALASYYLVEKPALDWARRKTRSGP